MEYTKLGNTDIEVSKLCVGCMSFGKAGTSEGYLEENMYRILLWAQLKQTQSRG